MKGSARSNSIRDETKVTPADPTPVPPPFLRLTPEETEVFNWLVAEFAVRGVHGRPDGLLIARLARRLGRLAALDEKFARLGPVVRGASGSVQRSPFYLSLLDEEIELRRLMSELGFSPVGRLKLAPPMQSARADVAGWGEFN